MRAHKIRYLALLSASLLLLPFISLPGVAGWESGDEAAIFGHTFDEEYWTNSSLFIEGDDGGNATLTVSYVGVGEFDSFLIAFNEINTNDGQRLIIPYQLFGMHFTTPNDNEVFIAAVFAFLLAHNETYGDNNLPDMGHDAAWYVVPVANNNPWPEFVPAVESIPAAKLGDGHYRFGMRYTNMPVRIVAANSTPAAFWLTLGIPVLTMLVSELVIEYDITIGADGVVNAETVYTIGQAMKAKWWGLADQDPSEIIVPSMAITAVHYLSVFTSNYEVRTSDTNTLVDPTGTEPLDEDLDITIGDSDRAFSIGIGREYSLVNESTNPWTTVSTGETALNTLLEARPADFFLILWQAPLSIWLYAHMAFGLSERVRNMYNSPQQLVVNAGTAFDDDQLWYGVTFPEWNGLRIEQDPTYTAYTNLAAGTMPTGRGAGIIVLAGIAIVVIVILIRRR
ncbi:MAG: hypothetical protein ACFFFC_18915 [Candidatus Thorarchaeota archaeon]